jgi:imidazolonepropionase-like amidohydrolase
MDMTLLVEGGTLIDGTGSPPIEGASITIERDIIGSIGKKTGITYDDVIKADGKFILPGLIDAHVHVGGSGGVGSPEEFSRVESIKRLYGYLLNGVTSVRSCTARQQLFEFREMEKKGELISPRLFISGPLFTAPKGHGTQYSGGDAEILHQMVRTPLEESVAREMVLEVIGKDVDFIKIIVEGRKPFQKLSPRIMCVVIDEAHKNGFTASVHTSEYEDSMEAVRCGADSLEHGVKNLKGPSDEIIGMMKEQGTYFVPTFVVYESLSRFGEFEGFLNDPSVKRSVSNTILDGLGEILRGDVSENSQFLYWVKDVETMQKRKEILGNSMMSLKWVRDAGIRIVAGSDAGNPLTFPGVSLHRELELLVQSGLSQMDAIVSATRNAANLLGAEEVIGTIKPGKKADLIILDKNPLEDISNTRNIITVIKNGEKLNLNELEREINPK